MTPRPYHWLGPEGERQHVFLEDRERSICQMCVRNEGVIHRPGSLWCGWCRTQLRFLQKKGRVQAEETL